MLIKYLSESDKLHLIDLAKLFALSDNPLLWKGKKRSEITSDEMDFDRLSIQLSEQEQETISDFEQRTDSGSSRYSSLESKLIGELKKFHRLKVERLESRLQAATNVFKEALKKIHFDTPSTPKIILFELIQLALSDDEISDIELALLKEFQYQNHLEDFIFDDLLERAEIQKKEINKTISIVLE